MKKIQIQVSLYSYEVCLDIRSTTSAFKPHDSRSVKILNIAEFLLAFRTTEKVSFLLRLVAVCSHIYTYWHIKIILKQSFYVAKIVIISHFPKKNTKKIVKKYRKCNYFTNFATDIIVFVSG